MYKARAKTWYKTILTLKSRSIFLVTRRAASCRMFTGEERALMGSRPSPTAAINRRTAVADPPNCPGPTEHVMRQFKEGYSDITILETAYLGRELSSQSLVLVARLYSCSQRIEKPVLGRHP